ncbi:MAG TPA: hypothetical protein VLL05_08595 [Terriglobales bacterium]|nr:hypothetical protein [Terriglobales bacterium]
MSIRLRRSLVQAGLLLLLAPATFVFAQAGAPKYDAATEAKFKVTVQDLKLPAKGNEKDVAHLLVKSGEENIDIYLAPKAFLDDMGASFAKGDEVTVTGSKIKQDGSDLVLAREVVKGTDTLMLRDDKGKPVWNWHK